MNSQDTANYIIEQHLRDYLDNAADELATAFNDNFERPMSHFDIDTICGLIHKRLVSIHVVW